VAEAELLRSELALARAALTEEKKARFAFEGKVKSQLQSPKNTFPVAFFPALGECCTLKSAAASHQKEIGEINGDLQAKIKATMADYEFEKLKVEAARGDAARALAVANQSKELAAAESKKVARVKSQISKAKRDAVAAVSNAVTPLKKKLLVAQNEVVFQKQVKHVLSSEKALIASELHAERRTREAQEKKSAAALMQLGSASLCAVEKERAAARELAADMAKVEKKLEAEKKRCSMEKEKRESLLAECERLALELEDAHDESDEGGDDGSFTPEETKPEKGDGHVRPGLPGLVGRKGEKYTLEMMELGMELMGQGMTAPKARSVLIIFMKKAHPDLIVGVDYRIPDPMMFKRWRTYLEPLSQFMALRAVDQAKVVHLLHDATSKKGVSFFSVCARITVNGKTQNVPLSFKVCVTVLCAARVCVHVHARA
jgi:hypothetical protein